MNNNESSKDEQKEVIRIDLIKNENNSLKILKSELEKIEKKPQPHQEYGKIYDEALSQIKLEIIEYYEKMTADIDLHTEKLLMSLPEALKNGQEELLEKIQQEKEKALAALGPDSPVVRHKNEYYQQFLELKEEYLNCSPNDDKKKEEINFKLEDLKLKVQVLEDFLEDFKNRTLTFEEVDKSVYESLIGELVLSSENQVDIDLFLNESLES